MKAFLIGMLDLAMAPMYPVFPNATGKSNYICFTLGNLQLFSVSQDLYAIHLGSDWSSRVFSWFIWESGEV